MLDGPMGSGCCDKRVPVLAQGMVWDEAGGAGGQAAPR